MLANYQSFKVSLVVLVPFRHKRSGALGMLLLTGSTLNLQSYGHPHGVGVSIANAVLMITNAEHLREHNEMRWLRPEKRRRRLRPIMTSVAMVAGMIPIATGGLGEGGMASRQGP